MVQFPSASACRAHKLSVQNRWEEDIRRVCARFSVGVDAQSFGRSVSRGNVTQSESINDQTANIKTHGNVSDQHLSLRPSLASPPQIDPVGTSNDTFTSTESKQPPPYRRDAVDATTKSKEKQHMITPLARAHRRNRNPMTASSRSPKQRSNENIPRHRSESSDLAQSNFLHLFCSLQISRQQAVALSAAFKTQGNQWRQWRWGNEENDCATTTTAIDVGKIKKHGTDNTSNGRDCDLTVMSVVQFPSASACRAHKLSVQNRWEEDIRRVCARFSVGVDAQSFGRSVSRDTVTQ